MDFSNIKAAVLVPGFLTGGKEFGPLCDLLTNEYNIPTIAVPMPNWHWIPCLGGRSARPMLERIDFTVKHLIANDGDITKIPTFDYNMVDLWNDFQTNPGGVLKVGGSSKVTEYPPDIEPKGTFKLPDPSELKGKKIALIGHSAGGWISRAYLSSGNYGGRSYKGTDFVHSLITLGTPHVTAPNAAFEGIAWCNEQKEDTSLLVPTLAVGGLGYEGGQYGGLTQGAYSFCCPNETDGTSYDGDGVTPIFSSTGLDGKNVEKLKLDDVNHFCWSDVFGGEYASPELTKAYRDDKRPWYGNKEIVDQWTPFLERHSTVDAAMKRSSSSSSSSSGNAPFFIKQ